MYTTVIFHSLKNLLPCRCIRIGRSFKELPDFLNKAMTDHTEKKCPQCHQMLRFPKNIGGMLMACPSCGKKFYSDFKLVGSKKSDRQNIVINVFEAPSKLFDRISRYFFS
jgi:hypothetical protein